MSQTSVYDYSDVPAADIYRPSDDASFLGDIQQSDPEAVTYNILFAPEIKELIHHHWYTFPPPSYAWHLTLAAIILVLGVISIAGNAAVIYIFGTTRALRNPSNALIVNLAISDFAMMITNCPMYFLSSLQGKWIFGREACRFYGFCGALFGTISIITIAAVAVDRYLVICKPFLIMKSTMTRERAKFGIAFVWIYSLGWALPPLFGVSNYVLEGFLTTCTFDYLDPAPESRIFIFAMFFGAFVAPLMVIIVCYLLIICEVYTHAKKFKKAASNMKGKDTKKQNDELAKKKKEVQTAKIACTITVCWVVAWTPYAIVALMGISSARGWLTPVLSQLPALFAKTAAVYNPLVYAISHPKYREALKKQFPWLICIKGGDGDSRPSTRTSGAVSQGASSGGPKKMARQMSRSSAGDSEESVEMEIDDDEQVQKKTSSSKRTSIKDRVAVVRAITNHASPLPAMRQPASASAPPNSTSEVVATYTKFPQPEVTINAKQLSGGVEMREVRKLSVAPNSGPIQFADDGEEVWQEKVTPV